MDLLVFLAALCLVVAALWQWQRRGQARRMFIESFDFGKLLGRRLAAKHPQLTAEQHALVLCALRDYFLICQPAGRRMVAMPSQVVDDAWHEFILFTRNYREFCRQAYGRFLHHTPAEAMRSPTQAQDGIKRAWRLACRREGIDPRAPAALPLLFAIDAQIGMPNGFRYSLDCMASGQAGVGYCASHIGCGGGCGGDGGSSGDGGGGDTGGGCGSGCGGGGD